MQLGSLIAMAVVQAGSCSSDLIPSLGTSICHSVALKSLGKQKKKKKRKKERKKERKKRTPPGTL